MQKLVSVWLFSFLTMPVLAQANLQTSVDIKHAGVEMTLTGHVMSHHSADRAIIMTEPRLIVGDWIYAPVDESAAILCEALGFKYGYANMKPDTFSEWFMRFITLTKTEIFYDRGPRQGRKIYQLICGQDRDIFDGAGG